LYIIKTISEEEEERGKGGRGEVSKKILQGRCSQSAHMLSKVVRESSRFRSSCKEREVLLLSLLSLFSASSFSYERKEKEKGIERELRQRRGKRKRCSFQAKIEAES